MEHSLCFSGEESLKSLMHFVWLSLQFASSLGSWALCRPLFQIFISCCDPSLTFADLGHSNTKKTLFLHYLGHGSSNNWILRKWVDIWRTCQQSLHESEIGSLFSRSWLTMRLGISGNWHAGVGRRCVITQPDKTHSGQCWMCTGCDMIANSWGKHCRSSSVWC